MKELTCECEREQRDKGQVRVGLVESSYVQILVSGKLVLRQTRTNCGQIETFVVCGISSTEYASTMLGHCPNKKYATFVVRRIGIDRKMQTTRSLYT